MRYLVDSDWVIDYMHGQPATVALYDELSVDGVGMSVVCLGELYEGMLKARDRERQERDLAKFLDGVQEIVPLDPTICRIFASQRSRLRDEGRLIPDFDILIGSTAIHHGFTLLTNNRRHYERMQGLNFITSR